MGKNEIIDPVTQFAESSSLKDSGQCLFVRQACERHLRDLNRGEFEWNLNEALMALEFCKMLKHYKGPSAGDSFKPEPWQEFIIGSIFGWRKKDGSRRFRIGYIEVPRKNGKTFMAASIALKALFADGESGAEVYSVAPKLMQSKIVWEDAKTMISQCPPLNRRSKRYISSIVVPSTSSKFLPLAKDTKTLDGLNPSFAISDEVHAWRGNELFHQMNDAMGARRQPFNLLITTAGWNKTGICWKLREHLLAVLKGDKKRIYIDDEMFGIVFSLDKGDDFRNPAVWKKANPNLGVSKSEEYMTKMVKMAQQIPSEEYTVKNKQFNLWTVSDKRWLDMKRWDKCNGEIDEARLLGQVCHLGIDLSTVQDLTAVVAVFPPGPYDEFVFYPRLYLPKERLDYAERMDRVPYKHWEKEGFLQTTPGDVIDIEYIKQDVIDLNSKFRVSSVGYDPWKAIEMATSLSAEGLDMVEMRQGHATLGAPTVALEALVLKKQIRHGNHPVLRWMAENTKVIRNSNNDIRPTKYDSRSRIDGIVATIMALGRYQAHDTSNSQSPSVHIIEI